jgi:hypothetical protein
MARSVEASIPPKTTVPSDCWLAEPAPVAVSSGTTPNMKAIEVIRIGRKRRLVASTAAARADIPSATIDRTMVESGRIGRHLVKRLGARIDPPNKYS